MDVLDNVQNLVSEQSAVLQKLEAMRGQNNRDFDKLVESTDPTLLSKDQQQLEELLNSADGNLRCAALCILDMRNWTTHLEARCRSLATADPDANVRGTAVLLLRKLYSKNNGSQIEALLARIVLNNDEEQKVRQAAFRALLEIRRVPLQAGEWKRSLQAGFPSQADLDYVRTSFVNANI
jgi:hypothetical protein